MSELLGNVSQASSKAGAPAIEARCLARNAIVYTCTSDRTLGVPARKFANSLRMLVVAHARVSTLFWTCLSEVVGTVGSIWVACRDGGVKPYVSCISPSCQARFDWKRGRSIQLAASGPHLGRPTLWNVVLVIAALCWTYALLPIIVTCVAVDTTALRHSRGEEWELPGLLVVAKSWLEATCKVDGRTCCLAGFPPPMRAAMGPLL